MLSDAHYNQYTSLISCKMHWNYNDWSLDFLIGFLYCHKGTAVVCRLWKPCVQGWFCHQGILFTHNSCFPTVPASCHLEHIPLLVHWHAYTVCAAVWENPLDVVVGKFWEKTKKMCSEISLQSDNDCQNICDVQRSERKCNFLTFHFCG